jgi:DNA-binding response OmpR family regulator
VKRPYILVVDDDADLRALVRTYLSRAGYEVAVAEGAGSAREMMDKRKPDLIITDIRMPTVDGVEFVAGLREHPELAGIPVIYLTGMEANADLAVRTLGYPLLAKPVSQADLIALVKRQLRRSG